MWEKEECGRWHTGGDRDRESTSISRTGPKVSHMYGDPNIQCPKCSYRWQTRSKLGRACCPSCGSKVTNPFVNKAKS